MALAHYTVNEIEVYIAAAIYDAAKRLTTDFKAIKIKLAAQLTRLSDKIN